MDGEAYESHQTVQIAWVHRRVPNTWGWREPLVQSRVRTPSCYQHWWGNTLPANQTTGIRHDASKDITKYARRQFLS